MANWKEIGNVPALLEEEREEREREDFLVCGLQMFKKMVFTSA